MPLVNADVQYTYLIPIAEVIGGQTESNLAVLTEFSCCLHCHAIAPITVVIGRGKSMSGLHP